ncbi:ROK family transcriptional regulator [Phycicoccus sp. Soil803]|uniref:ROK family transcriptional regulator n=1 Tax=Phycicoccus sp. Soil803 TaxID=1736415 RepID=UPI00070F6D32|nr:ROK family protein [Phycicoccus sp. Soil803]KRF25716.1 ROK family transcriptional regulator [Phycicoccus sp. Soil803]
MDARTQGALAPDHVADLVRVLDAVRSGRASTRPELAHATGLGRNVVTQRVARLMDSGLLVEAPPLRSTGGRAPRGLRFPADAGRILVAELGATSIGAAVSDLEGTLLAQYEEDADVTVGPVAVLTRVAEVFDELLQQLGASPPIWGLGIGLPGPVEFDTGRPVAPPIMPGWDGFDVRTFFAGRFHVPVWVDNDVNVMALGELRAGQAQGLRDVVYVKIGSGIGAGLISQGVLHRGAQGCAGDIGHVTVEEGSTVLCRCGKFGCLEALAGGAALARDGETAAREGDSAYLADVLAHGNTIDARAVSDAAIHGDPVAIKLLAGSARLVGQTLARIVNFFNPSLILVGGGVSEAGDYYLAEVRQTVIGRSLPLATRSLQIVRSGLSDRAGLRGAAHMVMDALLSPQILPRWLDQGTPAGRAELTAQ